MLDRRYRLGERTAEHGAQIGIADIGRNRLKLCNAAIIVKAVKDDARSGFCRLEGHRDRIAGMHANAFKLNSMCDSCLKSEQSDSHASMPCFANRAASASAVQVFQAGF
ncbi:hypothetical protein D3C72_1887750 [compost metagenome]